MSITPALITALKSLPRGAVKLVLYTTALGAITLAAGNVNPDTLPQALNLFFSGLGIEALGILLDRITTRETHDRETIRAELEDILSKSNIHDALNDPDFVRDFANSFANACFQIIRQAVQEGEGELAAEIIREFVGANLIREDIRELSTTVTSLLSKSDQKRDEQYDDVVSRIDLILQILRYQSVLSTYPRTKRPLLDIPLVGREDDFNWLIQKAQQGQDCLLVGQPGSGKSFLFRKLVNDYRALFVVGNSRPQLPIAIADIRPSVLMVDDAHGYPELLLDLKQIRSETGLPFAIFANCWPSYRIKIATHLGLPTTEIRELSLLSLDQIVEVLKSIGIEEPWGLVHELVNQAEGRPGLAVTLADLYTKGGHKEIFSGDAVANHLVREYIDHDDMADYSKEILAALSLGGDAGLSPTLVATSFELSPIDVKRTVYRLAVAGIILEVRDDYLSVRPRALRDVLIRDEFFSSSLMQQSLAKLLSGVPSLPETTLTLISARRRGAGVPDELLKILLTQIRVGGGFNQFYGRDAWISYTSLGPEEAQWVLDNGPEYLTPVAPVALWYVPAETIPRLLDMAVGDNRPLHSNTEHPLRILEDWVTNLNNRNIVEDRGKLVDAVVKWYSQTEEPEVSLRAVMLAFEPRLEARESDPGEGNTLTIQPGYFTMHGIHRLEELWMQTLEFLREIPINDWQPLLHVAHGWLYYQMATHHTQLPADVAEAAMNFARTLIADVASLAKGHQGVIRALENKIRDENVQLNVTVDPEFDVLYPMQDLENYQSAEESHREAALKLAEQWLTHPPEEVISKLEHFEREAQEAHLVHPRYTFHVCQKIAEHTTDPISWLDVMLAANLPGELLSPFLDRLSSYERDVWMPRVHQCLQSEKTAWIAIRFLLNQPQVDEEVLSLVLPRLKDMPGLVEDACWRGTPARRLVLRLLSDENANVTVAAAKGLWRRLEGATKDDSEYYPIWRRIVIENFEDGFLLGKIFEDDTTIAYEWLLHQLSKQFPQYRRFERALSVASQVLDENQKKSLLERIPNAGVHAELIDKLVNNNIELYRWLLSLPHLREIHLFASSRVTESSWAEMAIIALDAGYSAKEVAEVATRSPLGELLSRGERADRWEVMREAFSKYLTHEDTRIREVARVGQEYAQKMLDESRLEERRRGIYGRD